MTALAPALQAYFTDRLIGQRAASPRTIDAYRLTLRLLLGFAAQHTGTVPSRLEIDQLDAPLIAAFLDHLEHDRGNTPQTRRGEHRRRLTAEPARHHRFARPHGRHRSDEAHGRRGPSRRRSIGRRPSRGAPPRVISADAFPLAL